MKPSPDLGHAPLPPTMLAIDPRVAAERHLEAFRSIIDQKGRGGVTDAMATLNGRLRHAWALHGARGWKEIRDYLLSHDVSEVLRRDPITRRSVEKPRGYAGDAVLLDLIYKGWEGPDDPDDIGKAIHNYVFASPSCNAVRERRDILTRLVDDVAAERPQPRILAIAAGHLREADASSALAKGHIGEWIALDQDKESLAEVARRLGEPVRTQQASVADIITGRFPLDAFDLIYAAGLYDYLPATVAHRLTRRACLALKPGGRFLFANFASDVIDVGYMEGVMDWSLILRTADEMEEIARAAGAGCTHRYFAGSGDAILYCEIRRACRGE